MAFKIQITPRKSAQLSGAKARFLFCEKCHKNDFEEEGLLFKSIVCAHCGHPASKTSPGEGATFKRVESGRSTRKSITGPGARFKKSELDFGRRK